LRRSCGGQATVFIDLVEPQATDRLRDARAEWPARYGVRVTRLVLSLPTRLGISADGHGYNFSDLMSAAVDISVREWFG